MVFSNYEDQFFSPCILFSKKEYMSGIIKIAMDNCMEPKRDVNSACHRILDEVCGCNGVTYGNSCEAYNQGVRNWTNGKCKNSTTSNTANINITPKSLPPPAVIWTGE